MKLIRPDWPAPGNVQAAASLRRGGVSQAPWDSLNLGDHVGDDPPAVAQNRRILLQALGLQRSPAWLRQEHGVTVAEAESASHRTPADAVVSRTPGLPAAVLTADCLPVLFCDRRGTAVAAAHAGWRGLAAGVLEETVKAMAVPPADILAWLGPAIGPAHFEVGPEVRAAFLQFQPAAEQAFRARDADHWLADMYALARLRLQAAGVNAIFGGDHCTYAERENFFSYRREGVTGRQASLIWIDR